MGATKPARMPQHAWETWKRRKLMSFAIRRSDVLDRRRAKEAQALAGAAVRARFQAGTFATDQALLDAAAQEVKLGDDIGSPSGPR